VRARRTFVIVAALAAAYLSIQPLPSSAQVCKAAVGQRVLLESIDSDPDVFVWDNRFRLIEYAAGNFDKANQVMAHTVLTPPGTHAIVTMCAPATVKPAYDSITYDAIGIKITSGPNRNHWGWVSSEDVRI
jgi:hypothetical protein